MVIHIELTISSLCVFLFKEISNSRTDFRASAIVHFCNTSVNFHSRRCYQVVLTSLTEPVHSNVSKQLADYRFLQHFDAQWYFKVEQFFSENEHTIHYFPPEEFIIRPTISAISKFQSQ